MSVRLHQLKLFLYSRKYRGAPAHTLQDSLQSKGSSEGSTGQGNDLGGDTTGGGGLGAGGLVTLAALGRALAVPVVAVRLAAGGGGRAGREGLGNGDGGGGGGRAGLSRTLAVPLSIKSVTAVYIME